MKRFSLVCAFICLAAGGFQNSVAVAKPAFNPTETALLEALNGWTTPQNHDCGDPARLEGKPQADLMAWEHCARSARNAIVKAIQGMIDAIREQEKNGAISAAGKDAIGAELDRISAEVDVFMAHFAADRRMIVEVMRR